MPRRAVVVVLLPLVLALAPEAGALMALRPGEAPPGFTLLDLAGNEVGTRALAGAPSAILFWSTWSPRSAEMLEDFKRIAASYGDQGLKIVAVNIDGENLAASQREAIRQFAAVRDLPFPVVIDEGLRIFSAWGVMAHPTEIVLDPDGRIAYVLPGYPPSLREELEEQIRRVLGLPPTRPPRDAPSIGYVPQSMALQHYNLGRQLLAKGDHDKALDVLRRAAAADPGFLDASIMIARVSLASGELADAEALARQVSPEMINRGDLRYLLGVLMVAKGELDGAEQAFRGLRGRLPREGWWAWGLAQTALARGDREAALDLFKQARALQRDNPEGEAFVLRHFRERWLRRENVPGEDGFLALFPALGEVRESYRRLFDAPGAAPAAQPD